MDLSKSKSRPPPNIESHPLNRQNKFFDSTGPGAVAKPRSVLKAVILEQGGTLVEIEKDHIVQYAHFGYVYCMVLARGTTHGYAGEEILISGGGDGTIRIWQLTPDGNAAIKSLATLENGDNSVLSLAIDGTFLYSGRLDGDVNVWDLDTRQLIRTIKSHSADVLTITAGQDLIFSGGSNGWAKVRMRNGL